MSDPSSHRPAFLDELADDVVLGGSVLKQLVQGRHDVTRIVEAVGTLYIAQEYLYAGRADGRDFVEYDATLADGTAIRGLVSLTRDTQGHVKRVDVGHQPYDAIGKVARSLHTCFENDALSACFAV